MLAKTSNARWVQLVLGLIVMMAISSPQYVWTLFVKPLQGATGASLPALQITFSLLIVLQTWLSPAQGWLVERFGPKLLVAFGAALSGLGWVLSAQATSLTMLYFTYGGLCGIGTGIVYIGIVGLMARWFPDRRGFAIGMVAAGYGMGALMTTFPIDNMIKSSGYASTLVTFGLILGAIGVAAALGLRTPTTSDVLPPPVETIATGKDTSPKEMLKTPVFWLMFVMMTMMSTGGLMVTSNFANFAREFGVADIILFGVAALPLALTVDRILNGFTRPFFGWVSDRIGRENTMGVAFLLEAVAILLLLLFRENACRVRAVVGPRVLWLGRDFLAVPLDADRHVRRQERRRPTTASSTWRRASGSVLGGPVAATIHDSAGGSVRVFVIVVGHGCVAGVLALLVLKKMRAIHIKGEMKTPAAVWVAAIIHFPALH